MGFAKMVISSYFLLLWRRLVTIVRLDIRFLFAKLD
jgi:hypothetical protein